MSSSLSVRGSFPGLLAAIALLAACASYPGPAENRFDDAGLHVVHHEPGRCAICSLYVEARDSVLLVRTTDGLGAGIVVTAEGHLVTNAHVVGGAASVGVETHAGGRHMARVLAVDAVEDLALLQLVPDGTTWKPIATHGAELPVVGSEVFLIGHPLGLGWSVTRGVVSGLRPEGPQPMIQTDAAISPGNSGGPMLDADGHLIGVVTSKIVAVGSDNVAFARPAAALLAFLAGHGVAPGGVARSGGH